MKLNKNKNNNNERNTGLCKGKARKSDLLVNVTDLLLLEILNIANSFYINDTSKSNQELTLSFKMALYHEHS